MINSSALGSSAAICSAPLAKPLAAGPSNCACSSRRAVLVRRRSRAQPKPGRVRWTMVRDTCEREKGGEGGVGEEERLRKAGGELGGSSSETQGSLRSAPTSHLSHLHVDDVGSREKRGDLLAGLLQFGRREKQGNLLGAKPS